MAMSKATKAQLQELKGTDTAYRTEEEGNRYGLKILNRGEELFFQQNEDALICEISASLLLINPTTIKEWDNGKKISEEERAVLLEKILRFYKEAYKDELRVFTEK